MSISDLFPNGESGEPKEPDDPKESDSSDSSVVSDEASPSESPEDTPVTNSPQDGPTPTSPAHSVTEHTTTPLAQTAPSETQPAPETAQPKSQYDLITEALMARIGGVGSHSTFKVCIYGPPGGTKSSWLSQIPGNLVYDMEDGSISMKTQQYYTGKPIADGVRVLPFKSFRESELLMERLLAGDPALDWVKCFSIDTFSDFHKRALSDTVKHYHQQAPSSVNAWRPGTDHYTEVNQRLLEFVRNLRDLDRDVVITAHSRTIEPKGAPAKTYPDFSESLSNKIEAMMDIVGYMEMVEVEGNSIPVCRVISDGRIHAKTRVPLEPVIVNPQWPDWKQTWEQWRKDSPEEVLI